MLVEDDFISGLSDRWGIEAVRNGACKRRYKANGEAGGLEDSRLPADSHRLPKCLSKYQSNDINNIVIAISN